MTFTVSQSHFIVMVTHKLPPSWHVHLDDGAAGRVQLWQDGALVADASGPTLPFRTPIYNSLEVGISARSFGDKTATLSVDDIVLATRRLR